MHRNSPQLCATKCKQIMHTTKSLVNTASELHAHSVGSHRKCTTAPSGRPCLSVGGADKNETGRRVFSPAARILPAAVPCQSTLQTCRRRPKFQNSKSAANKMRFFFGTSPPFSCATRLLNVQRSHGAHCLRGESVRTVPPPTDTDRLLLLKTTDSSNRV